ncbi:MAG: phage tail length tape measure family protein [Rubrivivax sp.]|nr:phage tail length tape measure family protein [Rubrivivax sp.]
MSLGQYQQALRQLPMQITDVATSLASGMPLWLVAVQQGGQIRDSFNGAGNAFKGILSMVSPLTLGIGAIAGVSGLLAFAAKAAYDETGDLNRQIQLMGPTAQRSASQVRELEEAIAQSSNSSIGRVREMTAEMLKSGSTGVAALAEGTRAAVALQRLTGDDADKVAKMLAAAGKDAVDFAQRANAAYGFLSAAQFKNVISLKEQGREAEATRAVLGQLADTLEQRVGNSMTGLDRQIEEHNQAWSRLWATIKGFVSDETIDQRLAKLTSQLRDVDEGRNLFGTIASSVAPIRQEAAGLRNLTGRDAMRRVDAAIAAGAEQSEMERLRKDYEERLRLANRKTKPEYPGAIRSAQRQYQSDFLRSEKGAYDQNAQEESRSFDERFPRANVDDIMRNRSPEAAVRAADLAGYADQNRGSDEAAAQHRLRVRQAEESITAITDANKRGNAEMIKDAQARGQALIALDEEEMRRRIDTAAMTGDQIKRLNDEVATWRLLREQQLTEDLKPEWQRMVDAWADVGQRIKSTFDEAVVGSLQLGEQAFIRFATTGKTSSKDLTDYIEQLMAREAYRWFIGQAVQFGSRAIADFNVSGDVNYGNEGRNYPAPRASGGPVGRRRRYWVGEHGPEMLEMGGEDGWITSNEDLKRGAAGGGGTGVQVTLINQTGTPAQASATRMPDGGIEVILTAMKSSLADDINNGEGSVVAAMGNRFGLRSSFTSA